MPRGGSRQQSAEARLEAEGERAGVIQRGHDLVVRQVKPIMVALGWLDTTTPLVPWINGRRLVRVVPGTGTALSSVSGKLR